MMDPDRFWSIIETARREAADVDSLPAALREQLLQLAPDEIVAFDERFEASLDEAYRWNLWGAAYLMNGGCSDDGFHYFRAWLISCGGDIYRAALADPDSLAGIIPDGEYYDFEMEGFGYIARNAWCELTGQSDDMFFAEQSPCNTNKSTFESTDEDWDFEDAAEMQRRYPRLWQRFGW